MDEIVLVKGERGLGFSILDYQVGMEISAAMVETQTYQSKAVLVGLR